MQNKQGDAEVMLDASELLRPESVYTTKPAAQYRDYSIDPTDPIKERVRLLYLDMHTHQTYDFVKSEYCTERSGGTRSLPVCLYLDPPLARSPPRQVAQVRPLQGHHHRDPEPAVRLRPHGPE